MASRALHTIRALPANPGRRALASQQLSLARQSPGAGQYAVRHAYLQARVFARCQSTSPPQNQNQNQNQVQNQKKAQSSKQAPPTVGAILRKGLDFSAVSANLGKGGFKRLFRESPGELILALIALAGIGSIALYTVYLYFAYFYHSQFTKFPPDVAKSLRRALYYTNIKPDPKLAHKYYKRAMQQCHDNGLDPFSNDVLGIRIQISAWLEKIGNYDNAVEILDLIARDCVRWVETFEKSMEEGTLPKSGWIPVPKPEGAEKQPTGENGEEEVEYLPENFWAKRKRLLAKAVATNVKLGELCSDEHVLRPEESQSRLTWAVETALKELKRRHDEGVKEDEGPWMSAAEIGGTLEALARDYERKSQFQLAVPLFFHVLRLCEEPCHRPVIMNNLAASFAQHPSHLPVITTLPGAIPDSSEPKAPSIVGRDQHLQSAVNWAKNALAHAKDVKGDARTEECDEACAVSLCNLGDIYLMMGKLPEARKYFERGAKMGKELELQDAVGQAQAGLERVREQSA